jgi:uncharacterized protein (DUF488 family)
MPFDLFSIGHSSIPADRFDGLLRTAGVSAIADVRSTPLSRRFPWFSGSTLAARLAHDGVRYLPFGETLGGRPREPQLYCDGIADYEAMAKQPHFQSGLDRLLEASVHDRVCLLCAEREPLDCHRCLLVGRALAQRGLHIGHILHDGMIEPHDATERRLLSDCGTGDDLFVTGHDARLAAAYRARARAVAYRAKPGSMGANSGAETR